jgi:hypothetical protein
MVSGHIRKRLLGREWEAKWRRVPVRYHPGLLPLNAPRRQRRAPYLRNDPVRSELTTCCTECDLLADFRTS